MNSWKSTLLSACAPPLSTFIIGTGSTPRAQRRRDSATAASPSSAACAWAAASETPRIALAPRRDLFGVPSSSIRARSRPPGRRRRARASAAAISPLTFATARVTPLPCPGLAAVAQLGRLELARRGARGHRRAPVRAGAQLDLDLDRRVAAAVEDLAGVDSLDLRSLVTSCRGRIAAPAGGLAASPRRCSVLSPWSPRRWSSSALCTACSRRPRSRCGSPFSPATSF